MTRELLAIGAGVTAGFGVWVAIWFERRRRLRNLADRFVALTRARRAEIEAAREKTDAGDVATETPSVPVRSTQVKTKDDTSSGGTARPGAWPPRSLHRRNGRPYTEDPRKE